MSVNAILDEAKQMPAEDIRSLVLGLTEFLDNDSNAEVTAILTTRQRAEEMKSGAVKTLSMDQVFTKARSALGE